MNEGPEKCWNCGLFCMYPDPDWHCEGWLRCSKCGATYNPSSTRLGPPAFTTERVPGIEGLKGGKPRKFKPRSKK